MPPPSHPASWLSELRAQGLSIQTDPRQFAPYSKDESISTQGQVLAVAFPSSTNEVQAILKKACQTKTPVIPRGAGSGLSGAAVPFVPSVILSLEKMNRILSLDTSGLQGVVQPGVITGEFRREVEARGLYYPPLPSSMDYCTLGGNVSTNAGGLCAVKYGVTRKYVLGLEVVLASGEVLRTGGGFIKASTGFDLTQLIVGSEGLLGVITEITLSLLPLPKYRQTVLLPFPNMHTCAEFVCEILQTGHAPGTLELLPCQAVRLVQKREPDLSFPYATDQLETTFLLIEYDGYSQDQAEQGLAPLSELCERHGIDPIVCSSLMQRDHVWSIRRKVREAISREGVFVEADAVVPRARIADLVIAGDAVGKTYGVDVFSYGHAGDGNLHTYFLPPPKLLPQWDALEGRVLTDYFERVVALGGTISGEHGIGELKKSYLSQVFPPQYLEILRGVKRAFDPHNILNPHKVIPA